MTDARICTTALEQDNPTQIDASNVHPLYPSLQPVAPATPEELILVSENIKKKFLQLDLRIKTNAILAQQYELFQQGKLISNSQQQEIPNDSCLINPNFNEALIEYGKINDEYIALKERAIASNLLARNEVDSLEKTILLKNYKYHPTFQNALNKKVSDIDKKYQKLIDLNSQKSENIKFEYQNRCSLYLLCTAWTGVASLINGALSPLFIGGGLVWALDSLVTLFRTASLNLKGQTLKNEKQIAIANEEEKIQKEIKKPSNLFQQGFFRLCAARQSVINLEKPPPSLVEEKENIHPFQPKNFF
jgi:hypothetical protein